MTTPIQISDAELEVLKVLWEKSPQTSPEIVTRVQQESNWAMATIKSLLVRLVKKAAVRQECRDRIFYYAPLIDRETYQAEASSSFLAKVFNGTPQALLSCLVRNDQLSAEDLTALKKIIHDAEQNP